MDSKGPTLGEIRQSLPPDCRQRSYAVGLGLFFLMGTLVALSFWAVVGSASYWAKLAGSVFYGVFISIWFVIGHDACHGALTPSTVLNRILARLAFLPTLHPYVCWELGHNRLHHGWTNLRGVDYVYPPFSAAEFRALPAWRRGLERLYRTVPGLGLFYFIEIWWKHMIAPRASDFAKLRRGAFVMDLLLVLAFLGGEIVAAAWLAPSRSVALLNLFFVLVLPHLMWNWLMAFVTLQHHTHPEAPWFKDVEEWSFFHGQVHGTIHVRLPRWIEILFHNILDHTAHHVDPKIPLYRLPACQRRLEDAFPGDVVVTRASLPTLREVLRTCKLYDYEQHIWLDFAGRASAPPIPMQRWETVSDKEGAVTA